VATPDNVDIVTLPTEPLVTFRVTAEPAGAFPAVTAVL